MVRQAETTGPLTQLQSRSQMLRSWKVILEVKIKVVLKLLLSLM